MIAHGCRRCKSAAGWSSKPWQMRNEKARSVMIGSIWPTHRLAIAGMAGAAFHRLIRLWIGCMWRRHFSRVLRGITR